MASHQNPLSKEMVQPPIQQRSLLVLSCLYLLLSSVSADAASVHPVDYYVAGSPGDTWTYQDNLNVGGFTWTLSEISTGPNAGRHRLGGAADDYIIYDVAGNVLTAYETEDGPLTPPVVFPETMQTEQYYSLAPGTELILLSLPSVTVAAGTFNDVILTVGLDSAYAPNAFNSFFGLSAYGITAAVTDISWDAGGIGLVKWMGVEALTAAVDVDFELASTTVVPLPAAVWLFGSGLLGLVAIARRKASRDA